MRPPGRWPASALAAWAVLGSAPASSTAREGPATAAGPPQVQVVGPPAPATPAPALQGLDPVHEARLPNGARLRVLPRSGLPFVSVRLVLPAAGGDEAPGGEGLAAVVAAVLPQARVEAVPSGGAGPAGPVDPSIAGAPAETVARRLGRTGGTLRAGAGPDGTVVALDVPAADLARALALVAEVVTGPRFDAGVVETALDESGRGLRARLEDPDVLARRALVASLWEDHPYGRTASPSSLARLGAGDVTSFVRDRYRPVGASVIVVGDVEPIAVEALVAGALAGWVGPAAGAAAPVPPAAASGRLDVTLVHRAGAPDARVLVGQRLPGSEDPAWSALTVLQEVLAGPRGRLVGSFVSAGGTGAGASLLRHRGAGALALTARVAPEAVGSTVTGLLGHLRRLRGGDLVEEELEAARTRLTGALRLAVETPPDLADRLAEAVQLGPSVSPGALDAGLRGLTLAGVRSAAARVLAAELPAIVVVGDRERIGPLLAPLGPVRTLAGDLEPVDPAGAAPPLRPSLEGVRLRPLTLSYAVTTGGRTVGSLSRRFGEVPGGDGAVLRLTSRGRLGARSMEQEVSFTVPDFRPVASTARIVTAEGTLTVDVRAEGGRLTGTLELPGGARAVGARLPPGALLGEMLEVALWWAELVEGATLRLPVLRPERGEVEVVEVDVTAREAVTVPAGTWDTYRLEVGGQEPQTLWVRVAAPHLPVRMAPVGTSLVYELVELVEGGDGGGGPGTGGAR